MLFKLYKIKDWIKYKRKIRIPGIENYCFECPHRFSTDNEEIHDHCNIIFMLMFDNNIVYAYHPEK